MSTAHRHPARTMTAVDIERPAPGGLASLNRTHRIQLALTTEDPDTLTALAADQHPDVRAGAASNNATPAAILAGLADDPARLVRETVARNPTADADTIAKLTIDTDLAVQEYALDHPNTPGHALAAAASHRHAQMRLVVARHQNTPASTLTALVRDPVRMVALHVAGNPNTPAAALAKLAYDHYAGVRAHVASNPNTPAETLRDLAARPAGGSVAIGGIIRAARLELCRRAAQALTGRAHDVATALLTDWAGTDADLVATAEAVARDDHPQQLAPYAA